MFFMIITIDLEYNLIQFSKMLFINRQEPIIVDKKPVMKHLSRTHKL